ncbi:MAG: DNA polymerase III subunit gamma/tau [Tannerellaceae bacterium]|jgi:DNA polymerase-3 subunit gamma/tau|nr:DNA polymerase III subunit gamma/tau [Tannerellaceae bacterium]
MDNYIVSARKYRPSTFRSVVGQKSLTTTLKNAISNNKLAHAYLFCGPRGVGKTSCARIFAKTINCLNPAAEREACNVCESCQAFDEQRSYNIHELDAASNNSVDDIRALIDQVRIPPAIGKYKVFIIDEVHMLSSSAFNAFLKTLEEPPQHALFILATTEKHKVLPTILSRCQIYDFSRISIACMVEHLEYVAGQEGVTAEPEALNVIAQKADGGMRDALSIFDQVVSFTNGNITYQSVIDNLNVLDYEYYFRLTEHILTNSVRQAILTLNEILSKGFDGQNIITGLASHFRDLLVCKDEATLILFEVGASIRERYKETARRCPDRLLYKAIEITNQCDLNYRLSRNKRLLLELTLIQLCQLTQPLTPDDNKKKLLIEPVGLSGEQRQQQSPSQVAAVVTTQLPAGKPAATTAAPPISTSLKKIGKEEEKKAGEKQQGATEKEQLHAFGIADLLKWWDAYAEQKGGNAYLKGIMANCKPVLQENYYFEVAVHNPGQQDELLNDSVKLLPFLRRHLKNSRIQMRIRISETNEKKLAYTSSEKYEHLLSINPLLGRLKEEFNLILD